MPAPLTYSWIALAASAPVILLLTTWTLAVFHCRRRQWTTIDVYLVAILSQSIIQQFLGFIYAILSLIRLSTSTGDTICTGILWFFISIPLFKGATIASLAIDRWLFSTKFDYRLCVRKSHARYHIGVLAIISSTVGFTALLTFSNADLLVDNSWMTPSAVSTTTNFSFDQCTFIPFKFDLKFVIFYLGLHAVIVFMGMFATWRLSSSCCSCRCCGSSNSAVTSSSRMDLLRQSPNDIANGKRYKCRNRKNVPVDFTYSNTSTASSSVSVDNPLVHFSTPGLKAKAVLNTSSNNLTNESYREPQHQLQMQLQQQQHNPQQHSNQQMQQSQQQPNTKILFDYLHQNPKLDSATVSSMFRVPTSLALLVLTIFCTHFPLLAITIFSRYTMNLRDSLDSDGVEKDSLLLFNWPLTNVILWGQVIEGLAILIILLIVDSIVPNWIFHRNSKKQPLPSNILQQHFPPSITSNVVTKKNMYRLNNNSASSSGSTMIIKNSSERGASTHHNIMLGESSNNNSGSGIHGKNAKFPITNGSLFASLTAAAAANGRNNENGEDGPSSSDRPNNIYMSLNNDFDSFVSFDQMSIGNDDDDDNKKSYHARCASVTTIANDDFEFQAMPPSSAAPQHFQQQQEEVVAPTSQFNPRTFTLTKNKPSTSRQLQQEYNVGEGYFYRPTIHTPELIVERSSSANKFQSQSQMTSLSMNDLDLITTELDPPNYNSRNKRGRVDTPESNDSSRSDGRDIVTNNSSNNVSAAVAAAAEYKRMYRKRPRLNPNQYLPYHHHHNHGASAAAQQTTGGSCSSISSNRHQQQTNNSNNSNSSSSNNGKGQSMGLARR